MAEKRPALDDGGQVPAKRVAVGPSGGGGWIRKPTFLLRDYGSPAVDTVYGFDLDGTLIAPKSGKKFAVNSDDWSWWNPRVPARLKEVAEQGHKLVVFTNQKGLSTGKQSPEELIAKIDKIQRELDLPLLVIAGTGSDSFRKPRTGAWEHMAAEANGGVAPDIAKCLFIGDAAGRPALKQVKKDFSDSDLKFALNLGVGFQTPEEFFLGERPEASGRPWPKTFEFDPRLLGSSGVSKPAMLGPPDGGKQELVVVVGAPGSGKSSLAGAHFPGYVRANQDTLKTKEKCAQVCADALRAGKSAIVDNQNKDAATRKLYIDVAKAAGVPARAVLCKVPKDLCFHLNTYRALNAQSPEHRGADTVPSMVIHAYFKNVQPPATKEGFTEVVVVTEASFEPRGSPKDIALLNSFLS